MKTEETRTNQAAILLPELPAAAPLPGAVSFGFDDRAFPYHQNMQTRLIAGQNPRLVLPPGEKGSYNEGILFYGTVIKIGDTFHMWYTGNYGPYQNLVNYELEKCVICYATSKDGVNWEKPDLGLMEFCGSKHNNIVALDEPTLWSTAAVLYDPDDPDPNRRFKVAYEADYNGWAQLCVAFSPDGLRWTKSPRNPLGFFLEAAGIVKHRGMYYVTGQQLGTSGSSLPARRLVSVASEDFEHWSPCSAIGLDRSPKVVPPSQEGEWNHMEEVHLGAGLWNRGNVIVGAYGQWHGHPSGDRALVGIDLGFVISHDAQHYQEPIPDFKLVPAREQHGRAVGFTPALEQGQGMANHGDQTLFWYSIWHGPAASGVRMVTWGRDRFGMLKPFRPNGAQTISCPIEVQNDSMSVAVNARGLGSNTQLRISLLNRGFQPIPGFSGNDAAVMDTDGFHTTLRWKKGAAITPEMGSVRVQIECIGIRPEDANLHAIYVGNPEE